MPEVFIRRRMYKELGGYVGYMLTPVRELQEIRLSIIAELTIQAEQQEEQIRKQAELDRKARQGGMR